MNINYSFIIPHHNTPQLLQRLINSIPQREDIEIIVVDDNSDENKKAMVMRPDVSVFFIDKEHTKGAGHARNEGLKHIHGKWTLFADADDFYKEGFLNVLDDYVESDVDLVFYNIESVDSDTLKPGTKNRASLHQKLIAQYDGSKYSSDVLLYQGFSPWRRMIKTDLIHSNGLFFEEIPQSNDSFFSLQVSYLAKSWAVDQRTVYVLTYNDGSITYSKTTKAKFVSVLNVLAKRSFFYRKIGYPEWNFMCVRGFLDNSRWKYLAKLFKRNRHIGLCAALYYFPNIISINRRSSEYYNYIITLVSRKKKEN